MARKPLFSHGFSPTLITLAVMIAVLLERLSQTQASSSQNYCKQVGSIRRGFSLSVYDKQIKQFLDASKSVEDCIKLACKVKGANYAVYEDGECHALRCRKNACKLSEDAKSKQEIVGLARHAKKHQKAKTAGNAGKKSKKGDGQKASSASSTAQNTRVPSKDPSNWTLAFSTYVPPVNKTNPTKAIIAEAKLTPGQNPTLQQTKIDDKISKKTVKRKLKVNSNKSKKRTSKKSRKAHPKLHRKHTKRRSRKKSVARSSHALVSNHSSHVVHNKTDRFTRDYPYSYSQYQYTTPDNSYTTQETDWRRNMVPTTDDLYSYYNNDDRQSTLRSQLELSPIADQSTASENDQLFSLPITSLVRRTDIPQGSHHVSSVSIINDMLPDDGAKAYTSYNAARDVIPTDLSSQSAAGLVSDRAAVVDANGRLLGYKTKSIADTQDLHNAAGPVSDRTALTGRNGELLGYAAKSIADTQDVPNAAGFTTSRADLAGSNDVLSDFTGKSVANSQEAVSHAKPIGILVDSGAVIAGKSLKPQEQPSDASLPDANGLPVQQAIGFYPGYKGKITGNEYAAANYAVQQHQAPVTDIAMSDQPIKSDDIDLNPTSPPTTTKPPSMQNLVIVGLANQSNAHIVSTKDKASSVVATEGSIKATADPAAENMPMESELMDPDHVVVSKGMYHDYMKKVANLTTFANVLPAKEIPSVSDDVVHGEPHPATIGTSSNSIAPVGSSSSFLPVEASKSNPASSLLTSILGKATATDILKEPSISLDPLQTLTLLSSSASLNGHLTPSTSTPVPLRSLTTGIPVKKPQPNEIDAPLQNAIIPVSKNKEHDAGLPMDSDSKITATYPEKAKQKTSTVLAEDLPFPARLVLPAPTQGLVQPLSGLSTVSSYSFQTDKQKPNGHAVVVMPTPLPSNEQIMRSASTATVRLAQTPTLSADVAASTSVLPTAAGALQPKTTTTITKSLSDATLPTLPVTANDKSAVAIDIESPSLPTQKNAQPTDQRVVPTTQPTSDVTTNVPLTEEPTERPTSKPTPKQNNAINKDPGAASNGGLTLLKEKSQHMTYKQTSVKLHKTALVTGTGETATNKSSPPVNSQSHAVPHHVGAHITPGSATMANDNTLKHISPLSKPKLRLSQNGSVVVLNTESVNTTKRPGLSDVYSHYQLEARLRAQLRLRQMNMLKSGKGCSDPLGVSTGAIRNDQITASSQLSPRFAPARARLGLQKDNNGNAGGWCSDPAQNEHLQYLQIDFRGLQDVCRIALQGLYNARSWVTYYKVAFSNDGVRWSIYKESGKEKVLQGNIEQDDWTSYRLIEPIKARFIRILPESWEGKSICLRTEFYSENSQGNSAVYGRSNIPTSLQGMIDHLNFEKLDDVIVFDSSSMGNNAFLNNGAAVYDTHGKCRHAARLGDGADILLDGRNMRVKPREAISISVWVRVDQTEGVHSIFDTVGAHSSHVLGQYHFEIVGGAVRWFHRNENGTQIFSAITEPNLINPREWIHIVASYDSNTGDAKIYVNGSRVVTANGQGLLSQDWAGRVGIGRHKNQRDLLGDVDEFRIYNEAIQGEKIMELARECDFDKYYCGSVLTAERGMLITPDYPSMHHGPVQCVWEIKGLPGEIIALDIKEFDLRNCNRSKLDVKDASNGTLLGSYCGDVKPGRIISNGNQMTVEFNSDGFGEGERFRVEFQRERRRASKKTMSSVCRNSDVYQNVTLVGGSKAGLYTDLGKYDDMKACQEKCCEKETCEIAFMIDGNCYAVRCFDQDVCKIRKAKSSNLSPMLSFITREGIPTRVLPIFVDKALKQVTTKPQVNVNKKQCQPSRIHNNSTLVKGMKSGNFTSRGTVDHFEKCLDLCCQSENCDAAFMVKKTCFSVQCYSKESCASKVARPSPFNPTLAYIIKGKPKQQDDALPETKSSVMVSGACAKSRVSKIYRNITLKYGVKSGEFTDRGSVRSMDDCLKHCCSDENCNLAFVIKETCFTVKCKSYESCSLKTAISKYYNPRIAYVNWSPPRDNMGDSGIRYDYKGCWKDFDMSAFALPLLEGTDALITGPYKKREDPVNDCATVSQNRGYTVFAIQNGGACFSGPTAEHTYKRYGQSDACKGGRGGAFANSVYKLFEDGSVMSLGCWADLQDRAFRRLEKIDPGLQDNYVNRANPIDVCAKVAKSHNTNTFALQKSGQCFIGKGNQPIYERYGPSRKCRYGLGGQMANDVYFLRDVGATVSTATKTVAVSQNAPLVISHNAAPVKPVVRNITMDDKPVATSVSETALTTTAATTATTTTTTTTATTPSTTPTTPTTTAPTTTPTTPTTPTTRTTKTTPGTTAANAISKSDSSKTFSDTGDLKPGEIVYKEELTDTEHVRFIYLADAIIPNATVASGISAGTFTDKGTMEKMEDCVRSCGETSNCDLAFKLGKQCFGVACYNKDSCTTKPAFSSYYNPLIAYVKHRTIKTQRKKEEAQIDSNPTQRSLCKAKNMVENVTLVDGIGAGNFTDLGHVSTMDDCLSRCCGDSACELAFKIEDDCYGVTCYSESSCRTRAARNAMVLRPMIAFVRDVGSRNVLETKASPKSEKPSPKPKEKQSTCSSEVWDGEIQENVTLVGGVNAGEFTDHGQTDSFNECMSFCCDSKDCDLAFMIDSDCYGVKCKDPSNCKTRTARPTKYRPMIAFKKSTETGTTPGLSSTSMKSTYAATPTFGEPSSKHSCEAGSIIYNATLKMGMHSGLFTKLGRVKKMDDCIERCCKSSNADVAFMLGSVCFAVKCYTAELCKTSPALISNIGNLNMNPTLSFLKKKQATMTSGNAIVAPGSTCNDSPITYNVTLKGGIHAGNFTNQGEGLTPRECIGKCCDQKSCDLAFMFADLCYSVKCRSDDDCQAVVAKPSNLSPKVSYVTRNKVLADRGTMFDVVIDNPEDQVCDDANLEHSPILVNKTLTGGLNAGNFSYLGKTKSMRECLGKCCSAKKCDVAYRIDRECFSVKCFSPDLCKVASTPAKNGFVQLATMSRKDKIRRINTQSIAVYVIIGVLCFTVGITAIGWAMCMYLKRKNKKNQQQQTDDQPMPDR